MSTNKISKFRGKYEFLSNFSYLNPFISYDGVDYGSVERAFQAAKIPDEQKVLRRQFLVVPTNQEAKKLGRFVPLRSDWEQVKLGIMEDLIRQKFSTPEMKKLLLSTGDMILEEGNDWGDTFWGVCKGKGSNHLGKILMKVREELR